ncbi:TraR/DksA C4-type zinc finger protein [bacterium]|nr:TraR/DksA C4-type zinc finger protein [bacterium]
MERKKQLLDDLENIGSEKNGNKSHVKIPEYGNKPDENAQEISEYTANLATDSVLKKSIRDIDNALERIKKGEYGICKYCGEPIEEKRLLARPVASACVECKTKLQNS